MFRQTAHVYDLLYAASGKDYAAESAQLAQQIRASNPGATSLLDVACGTGGHLVHLREQFPEVAGVDLDDGMLAIAAERLPGAELVEADMRSFELGGRFDAVTCLFSSIGYMPSVDDLHRAAARMAAHLAPDGVLIVDGWIKPEEWIDPGTVQVVCGQDDERGVARVGRSHRDGDRTTLELHHLVGTVDGIEHLVDVHELTLFRHDDYVGALESAGLAVEVVDGPFGDVRDRYRAVRPA